MITKVNLSGSVMADALKEMFEKDPKETAFRIDEIARYLLGGRKPDAAAMQWVFDELPKARRRLEAVGGMAFIPVTDFYFAEYYGKRPPRTDNGAVRCVAGLGKAQKTAGIRKLWIGYKNDGMAFVWLTQGQRSGGGKLKKTTNRVLDGYAKGHLTKEFAQRMIEVGFAGILPDDRKTFAALLPQATQQNLIKAAV